MFSVQLNQLHEYIGTFVGQVFQYEDDFWKLTKYENGILYLTELTLGNYESRYMEMTILDESIKELILMVPYEDKQ